MIDWGTLQQTGFFAWLMWSVAYIFLVRFRNRVTVALNWLWNYLTYQRSARLITGDAGDITQDAGCRAAA